MDIPELQKQWQRVMAKAWTDSDFMNKLQKDPKQAINAVAEDLELYLLVEDLSNPDNDNYFPLPDSATLSQNFPELPADPTEDDYITLLSDPEKGKKISGLMGLCCI
ncbi:MAG: nitrile hydratase subunit alpha [Moorea sp. SIO2B7]|nr:nitrile hydratase subunit alpha [Moorena sp. SIO2B7]